MSPAAATGLCVIGIVGLFILDRDPQPRPAGALWVPVIWLLIAGSRPVSAWLQAGPMTDSASQHNIESDPINLVLFSLLLAAGSCVLTVRRQRVGILLQENWPIILFFSYCALSVLWSDYPGAASRKLTRSLGDLMMIIIVVTDHEPAAALRRLLARTGFVLIPLSILLIKYYPDLGRSYSNSWELMYKGVTDHKNTLGMVCLVLGLGFWWRLLEDLVSKGEPNRIRHLLADGAILAMVGWLFWIANSLTSLSCFLMASVVIAITKLFAWGRKAWVLHVLVVALVSLSLFALFFDSGGNLVESLGRDASLTGRTAIWRQVAGMARNPLIGTGFESFWLGRRLQKMWSDNIGATLNEAHNGYLEVYLNLGWCGVMLLVIVIITGYRNSVIRLRRDSHIGSLKLAYFVAGVIYCFTEAGFRMLSPMWIFFLLATARVPRPSSPNVLHRQKQAAPRHNCKHEYGGAI